MITFELVVGSIHPPELLKSVASILTVNGIDLFLIDTVDLKPGIIVLIELLFSWISVPSLQISLVNALRTLKGLDCMTNQRNYYKCKHKSLHILNI